MFGGKSTMAILDLIQLPDERGDEIVRRVPESGSGEFKLGSQLVVRENQQAVFFRDGKALDVFGPGRHTISTNNIPLLTGLIGLPFGGDSPFTAEVYFVSMREFTDMKWGTPQPLVFRDKDFGMIRLRAHGTYSMKAGDPQLFVTQIVGARGAYSTSTIDDFLKSVIINEFNDLLGESHASLLDIQGMTLELASTARNALTDDFERLGLQLTTFQIVAITPPDEVQQRIDERSGMAAVGDMGAYTQYKTAQAIGDAANNPGGAGDAAATGAGLGAGMAIGQSMAQSMTSAMQQKPEQAQPTVETITCPNCQASVVAGSKFCPNCGKQIQPATLTCPKCGHENAASAKFCVNCGNSLGG
jgi:membrane protease subunit (stomatin/prohibitin family)